MTLNPFNKDEFNRESKIGIFVEINRDLTLIHPNSENYST
jgi:hypothetical protein